MKNLALFVVLALTAGGLYWLLGRPAETTPETNTGLERKVESSDSDAARSDATLDPQGEVQSPSGDRTEVSAELESADRAEPAANRKVDVIIGPRRTMRVFDRASGEPIAGAEVYQFDPQQVNRDNLLLLLYTIQGRGFDLLDEKRDTATFLRTDEAGYVDVAERASGTLVEVIADAQRGYGVVGGEYDTGDWISMTVPRDLVAHAQDQAGVPIAYMQLRLVGDWWGPWAVNNRTNDQGNWTLYGANTLIATLQAHHLARAPRRLPLEISVEIAGLGQASARADLLNPEPIELTMIGKTVRVTVVDHEGQPWFNKGASVGLLVDKFSMDAELIEGQPAVFRGLPQGAKVSVRLFYHAQLAPSEFPQKESGVVGPDGLDLTITMGAPSKHKIVFRAVDTAGQPLPNLKLYGRESFNFESGPSSFGDIALQTDEEGYVRFGSGALSSILKGAGHFRLSLVAEVAGEHWMPALIELTSEPSWPYDLGDLVFAPAAAIVAGLVQAQDGKPLAGVTVQADSVEDKQGDYMPWLPTARSQADGSFAIYAHSNAPEFVVSAEGPSFGRSPKIIVPRGTDDLVLQMTRDGSILVTLAPSQLEYAKGLDVSIEPLALDPPELKFNPSHNGGYSSDGTRFWSAFDKAGQVLWSHVPAGIYKIELHDGVQALMEWTDVRVVEGQQTTDPRLQGLRPSDVLEHLEVRVFDTQGTALPKAKVAIKGSGTFNAYPAGTVNVMQIPVDLIVSHKGYLSKVVTATSTILDVQLETAPTVSLRFPAPITQATGVVVNVALVPIDLDGNASYGPETQWSPVVGDTVILQVEGLGKQAVMIHRIEKTDMRHSSTLSQLQLAEVQLDAASHGQTFDLELTDTERAQYCQAP